MEKYGEISKLPLSPLKLTCILTPGGLPSVLQTGIQNPAIRSLQEVNLNIHEKEEKGCRASHTIVKMHV